MRAAKQQRAVAVGKAFQNRHHERKPVEWVEVKYSGDLALRCQRKEIPGGSFAAIQKGLVGAAGSTRELGQDQPDGILDDGPSGPGAGAFLEDSISGEAIIQAGHKALLRLARVCGKDER